MKGVIGMTVLVGIVIFLLSVTGCQAGIEGTELTVNDKTYHLTEDGVCSEDGENAEEQPQSTAQGSINEYAEVNGNSVYIWTDAETGVQYFVVMGSYNHIQVMSPRYNADGTLCTGKGDVT